MHSPRQLFLYCIIVVIVKADSNYFGYLLLLCSSTYATVRGESILVIIVKSDTN